MSIENLDSRAKAASERRRVKAGPDATETHEIEVAQGQEPMRTRTAGPGQIESSVAFSDPMWREPEREKGYRVADEINTDPVPTPADAIVRIKNITIEPNPVQGWEAKFTRNHSAYIVTVDGQVVTGDGALAAIYSALREAR